MPELILPHQHCDSDFAGSLQAQIQNTKDFQTVSDNFKQLGDPTRLRIFWLLCHCEECVTDIAALMEMSSPAVSHHLRLLRETGLIDSRRDGKEVFYKAAETPMAVLLHSVIEQIMEITCPE